MKLPAIAQTHRRFLKTHLPVDALVFSPKAKYVYIARDGRDAVRELPNVHFLHFAKLKEDMPARIREVAAFLEIPIDERKWDAMVEHCSFESMKQNATSVPLGGAFWDGAKTFVNKGTNGRWRDTLTADDIAKFEAKCKEELGEACAHWFATGEHL